VATVLTETEQFGWATILLIIGVTLAQWLHVVNLLTFASTHALATVMYVLAYVAVGIVWSFIKWFSFLMSARDRYREWKIKFLTKEGFNPDGQIPEEKRGAFKQFIYNQHAYNYQDPIADLYDGKRPRAANNKARIVSWMSLWPCSVIGTLLNDPVRRVFNFLFFHFKELYQKLADRVFRNDTELS
jgi:hypothetical protein